MTLRYFQTRARSLTAITRSIDFEWHYPIINATDTFITLEQEQFEVFQMLLNYFGAVYTLRLVTTVLLLIYDALEGC